MALGCICFVMLDSGLTKPLFFVIRMFQFLPNFVVLKLGRPEFE